MIKYPATLILTAPSEAVNVGVKRTPFQKSGLFSANGVVIGAQCDTGCYQSAVLSF